jgi:hypothetical protein
MAVSRTLPKMFLNINFSIEFVLFGIMFVAINFRI